MLLVLIIPLLPAAAATIPFVVRGVQGKLLQNIQSRLEEIADNKPLDTTSNEELRDEISQALYPFGYFNATSTVTRQDNQLFITVKTGPQTILSKISTQISGEGRDNPAINSALKKFPLKTGQAFNSNIYDKAKQSLVTVAETQGYLHASFAKTELLINREANTAAINLIFDTGPQYYFGQVEFDPTYISPELLHRYIPFQIGAPYSTEQLQTFNTALASSGYFNNVIVKPDLGGQQQTIPVHVHMQRAHRINYSLGLGFGTDTGIRGRLGYHVVPVNRFGHKFNLIALGSFKENRLQGQYIIPGKNPLIDQYDLFGSLSSLNYGAGYSNSALITFAQRHNLSNFQRVLSLNSLYERFNYDNTPKYESITLFPKATLTWLNKSDPLFSPNGYNLSVSTLGATKALLSEINFMQASIDAKAAYMVEKTHTRFYVHGIQGLTLINDINQLPLSLSLLLGGADNLKAYTFNSIGPGKILSYGGIEVQQETYPHWYLMGFLDSGDVYNPSPRNWQSDVGLGLMWVSPIGPIKVGVAQGIADSFHHFERKPRLVINMGPDL